MPTDPYDLRRFVRAQEPVLNRVLAELGDGRKRSHWMWFIFPQIIGLGHSPMARKYAISSLAEAEAYVAHPVLGPTLETCARLVNRVEGRSANDILGYPDDLKFHSSMTLFAKAAPDHPVFVEALAKYFDGKVDAGTLSHL